MLREGKDLTLYARAALVANDRVVPTVPQHRWVLPYLPELKRDPHLLDGFSAVLSDYLAAGGGGSAEIYEGVKPSMLTILPSRD
jgi:hypothetical protein